MKTVNAKATLSESAKALLSSRDSAREVLKLVIESQTRPNTGEAAKRTLHSSGMYILSERPKTPGKFSREV
ncbi:hypothetical protein ABIA68_000820 [Stenotrophomonas rhizophila]|uniref:hypothetical protein n=1 Tax=Stenotrophomonas rhizophila TaxID=216778 RepID=UPI003397398C